MELQQQWQEGYDIEGQDNNWDNNKHNGDEQDDQEELKPALWRCCWQGNQLFAQQFDQFRY